MERFGIVTGVILIIMGLVLCFIGYKLYLDLMAIYLVLIEIVMGLQLYLTFVEKNTNLDSRILIICLISLVLVTLMVAMMINKSLVYYLFSLMISIKLGAFIHSLLAKRFSFFFKESTMLIPVLLIFGMLALLYF